MVSAPTISPTIFLYVERFVFQKLCSIYFVSSSFSLFQLATMEGTAALFQGDMTYKTIIDGDIGGEKFQVIGDGTSKFPHGDFNIHAVCTTGTLPMSWKVMCHILQYGVP